MTRDVKPPRRLLRGKEQGFVPFPHIPDLARELPRRELAPAEEQALRGLFHLLEPVAIINHGIDEVERLGAAPAQRVEGPGLDQALQHSLVDRPRVRSGRDLKGRLEAAALPPLPQDLAGRRLAHVLDGGPAEPDLAVYHREVEITLLDG